MGMESRRISDPPGREPARSTHAVQSSGSRQGPTILPAGTVSFLVADDAIEVFGSAAEAAAAALARQRAALGAQRIAITTGDARRDDSGEYSGPARERGLRLRAVAHPGQILLSSISASLVAEDTPDGAWLDDLGIHRLHDLSQPERIHALHHPDLKADSRP